jgi:hypothetical protein
MPCEDCSGTVFRGVITLKTMPEPFFEIGGNRLKNAFVRELSMIEPLPGAGKRVYKKKRLRA